MAAWLTNAAYKLALWRQQQGQRIAALHSTCMRGRGKGPRQ